MGYRDGSEEMADGFGRVQPTRGREITARAPLFANVFIFMAALVSHRLGFMLARIHAKPFALRCDLLTPLILKA